MLDGDLDALSLDLSEEMPSEFDEWFQLARSVDVVQASSLRADITRHQPGVLCVLTPSGIWEPFDEMRLIYSIKRLRSMLADRQEMMRSGSSIPPCRNPVDEIPADSASVAG